MSNYTIETPVDIAPSGTLRLFQTNSTNAISISSAAGSSNVDFTLPSNADALGQFHQRNSATTTRWFTATASQTGNSMPINIRLDEGNLPCNGASISSGTFTLLTIFTYRGALVSQPMRTMKILFSVTPAASSGEIRLVDVTGGNIILNTTTCTSPTTALTIVTTNLNQSTIPSATSVMEISARVTTATTITFRSVLFT
jgi:hypothetical protein